MKKLSQDQFVRAREYLRTQARPLELRRFEFEFENGPADGVLSELWRFQNEDGGFGRGIEPDFHLADSSPMATTVAFQPLREVRAPADHPRVQAGIRYLVGAYDPARGYWPSVPQAVNGSPHAPWWHFIEADGKAVAESPANPSVEVVACLRAYPETVPAEFLDNVTAWAVQHLELLPEAMNVYDLLCYLRLAPLLPAEMREDALEIIRKAALATVSRDPSEWAGHSVEPLTLQTDPDGPLAGLFPDAIQRNLDFRIDSQGPDGSWPPSWDWSEGYPSAWEDAFRAWSGVLTLENLRTLRRYGRIENAG